MNETTELDPIALDAWHARCCVHVPADLRPSPDDVAALLPDPDEDLIASLDTAGTWWLASPEAVSAITELDGLTSHTTYVGGRASSELGTSLPKTGA